MLAIVNCKTCELSAKYSITADDSRTLSFDAAQFHALCNHADPLRALDCPDLTGSIKASMWGVSAGICTPDHLAISAGELRRTALAKRLAALLAHFRLVHAAALTRMCQIQNLHQPSLLARETLQMRSPSTLPRNARGTA